MRIFGRDEIQPEALEIFELSQWGKIVDLQIVETQGFELREVPDRSEIDDAVEHLAMIPLEFVRAVRYGESFELRKPLKASHIETMSILRIEDDIERSEILKHQEWLIHKEIRSFLRMCEIHLHEIDLLKIPESEFPAIPILEALAQRIVSLSCIGSSLEELLLTQDHLPIAVQAVPPLLQIVIILRQSVGDPHEVPDHLKAFILGKDDGFRFLHRFLAGFVIIILIRCLHIVVHPDEISR